MALSPQPAGVPAIGPSLAARLVGLLWQSYQVVPQGDDALTGIAPLSDSDQNSVISSALLAP